MHDQPLIPIYSLILHMYPLGSECPAGGRPPDMWNNPKEAFICMYSSNISDKTTHANWVLQRPQSHNDAFSLPRGLCVWLFLCSDIQEVYSNSVCVHVCVSKGLCVPVPCICVSANPTDLRVQCLCAIRDSSRGKKNSSSGVCSHTKCPTQLQRVPPNGSPASCFLGLDMTISNVIVSLWPFKDLELILEKKSTFCLKWQE